MKTPRQSCSVIKHANAHSHREGATDRVCVCVCGWRRLPSKALWQALLLRKLAKGLAAPPASRRRRGATGPINSSSNYPTRLPWPYERCE